MGYITFNITWNKNKQILLSHILEVGNAGLSKIGASSSLLKLSVLAVDDLS